ncbi:MAG: diacylglycerol kinase family lipid kinase [Bacteroidales bacterium]|nr:diacylglycerol kinase family lipid kinase [Bacteroidales bacterium]
MLKKWIVIVNPNAGGGKCGRDWPKIETLLLKTKLDFESILTERKFHAMVLSRKFIKQGHRNFIVVGGDGTLHEVINGIFSQEGIQTTEITLGVIPVGTGNDWSRMFGIPRQYEKAIQTLITGNTFIQDIGRVLYTRNDKIVQRYFLNIAGMGFDAMVAQKSNDLKEKGKTGKLLYFWNIFIGLFGYKHFPASLNIDGEINECDIFSMNIGICQFSGGGMKQVPNAIADDGIFDLTIIKKIGKFNVIKSLPMLYNGRIIKHPRVMALNGKKIKIESDKEVFLETDGESLGNAPFEFEIIPRSLKVITAS